MERLDGRWIIRSNWQAPNFRLLEVDARPGDDRAQWRELVAHREDAFIHGFDVFRDFVADRRAIRRAAQDPHPAVERWRRLLPSAPMSRPTRTYRGQNAEIDTRSPAIPSTPR